MVDQVDTEIRTSDEPQPKSVWHSKAVKTTLHQQLIQKALDHAEHCGVLESKGGEVNDIIRQYISKPPQPDYDGARKAIEALTTLKERAMLAGKRIAKQNAEALERTKDPLYETPLTPEMLKERGVEIEDVRPFPANGGKSEAVVPNEADAWFGEKPIELRHKWTCEYLSGQAQIGSCLNHWKREIYKLKPISNFYDLTRNILGGLDVPQAIEERGITLTVDLLQEALDSFDNKEPAVTTEAKPETKETTHWAKADGAIDKLAEALVPSAVEMGFDTDKLTVLREACKSLGIAKVYESPAKSSGQFKALVLKAWKEQKAQQQPKEEEATEAAAETSEPEAEPQAVEEQAPAEPVKKLEPHPLLAEVKTLTGIPVGRIAEAMNRHFPKNAYGEIPKGVMKGKTDLEFAYVRERFDLVFGPHGFGWKFEPHPVLGKVDYRAEERVSKEQREYTKHIVTYICHVLKYAVIVNDQITWMELSPMSDSDENEDLGYACRGAFTSLLKQALRGFGGMDHILKGEFTHVQANKKAS